MKTLFTFLDSALLSSFWSHLKDSFLPYFQSATSGLIPLFLSPPPNSFLFHVSTSELLPGSFRFLYLFSCPHLQTPSSFLIPASRFLLFFLSQLPDSFLFYYHSLHTSSLFLVPASRLFPLFLSQPPDSFFFLVPASRLLPLFLSPTINLLPLSCLYFQTSSVLLPAPSGSYLFSCPHL